MRAEFILTSVLKPKQNANMKTRTMYEKTDVGG